MWCIIILPQKQSRSIINTTAQSKELSVSFNNMRSEMRIIHGMNFPVTLNLFQKNEERRKINPINQSIVNKDYKANKRPNSHINQRCI